MHTIVSTVRINTMLAVLQGTSKRPHSSAARWLKSPLTVILLVQYCSPQMTDCTKSTPVQLLDLIETPRRLLIWKWVLLLPQFNNVCCWCLCIWATRLRGGHVLLLSKPGRLARCHHRLRQVPNNTMQPSGLIDRAPKGSCYLLTD